MCPNDNNMKYIYPYFLIAFLPIDCKEGKTILLISRAMPYLLYVMLLQMLYILFL